jgi:enediyne biosynthesis protein E4
MTDEVEEVEELALAQADAPRATNRGRPRWVAVAVAVGALTLLAIGVWLRAGRSSTSDVASAPHFVEEAAAAGVDHRYEGDFEYFVGGGVAAFDCDDDGRPELYFAGGSEPAALYRNESDIGGELRFDRVASPVTDLEAVTGAYPIDVDSDGVMDLVVLRNVAGNVVLRGLGGCRFETANERLDLSGGSAQTVAFSATWEGTNELPTLAFGNYLVPSADDAARDCDSSLLVRPAPSGDVYDAPIPLPGHCTLSVLFSDWDRSGRSDLRMTNDRHYYREGGEQLWRIEPGAPPREYVEADGWHPLQIFGMGIASRDLDGDGYPEVFLTSQGDNKLQSLDNAGTVPAYHDTALERGVLAQRPFAGGDVLPSTAWHAEFQDVNNDGFVDLFISKGNVSAQLDSAMRDPSNLLLGAADGTFREGAEDAGIVGYERARGAAVVDLNLDGLADLVVVNREAPAKLWRNVGRGDAEQPQPMGHWLAARLHQPAPNVDAVGAWLDVRVDGRVSTREVTVGGGHAGGQSGWLHTGLGDATTAEVRVRWPDGETGPWMAVAADQFVTIERGAAAPTPWQPSP